MLGLFATTSCDDFLDVQPKGEKVEEDLFSTYKGFESAIYGVYGSMSNDALYGCDLLWGTTELLAQNLYSTSTYGQDMGQYEYSRNQASRDRIGRIWTTAYISTPLPHRRLVPAGPPSRSAPPPAKSPPRRAFSALGAPVCRIIL